MQHDSYIYVIVYNSLFGFEGHYQERYDNRKSLGDWDYQYCIKESASIIHIKLYREWRNSGIAFEFGDQTYEEGNRTLASYVEGKLKEGLEKGQHKEVRHWYSVILNMLMSYFLTVVILTKDQGVLGRHRLLALFWFRN